MKTSTTKNTIAMTDDLSADALRLEQLRREQADLEKKLRLARGTQDFPRAEDAPLPDRMELVLRSRPRSIEELARDLHEPVGKIAAALKPLRKNLFNVGTEGAPAWFWIVGDEAPTDQLNTAVAALVKFRPMRFPELMSATGARQGRVSGAIVAMQRDPKSRIVNLDTASRARWFIVPEGIQLSRLSKR